jgi:serine/threonine protein kinase
VDPPRWQRIGELFAMARLMDGERRIAFLKENCGPDQDLFEHVKSLLDIDNQQGLLDSRPTASTLGIPQLVGSRFRIIRYIAEGGMGTVYEAEDLQLHDHVALKTIRPEIASDPKAVERFKQEIRLGKRVTHPNVCRIHDLGTDRSHDGTEFLFLTMQFLVGETLSSRIRRGPIPKAEALPLIEDMADALSAAHEAEVIHRDFKSGNVMLVPGVHRTCAIVTDFGLARGIRDGASRWGLVGTVDYMAPEQIMGGEIAPATDIYALGVVMYEMVTGRRPFTGDSREDVAQKHLHDEPQPPRELSPHLDANWNEAILGCLRKLPSERFQSAAEVKEALVQDGDKARRRFPIRRERTTSIRLVALSIAASLALFTVGLWWWRTARPTEGPLALKPFTHDHAVTDDSTISDDGGMVAYVSDRDTKTNVELYVESASHSGPPRQLTFDGADKSEPSLSPDGDWVAFRSESKGGGIYVMSTYGGDPRLVAEGGRTPRFSPNGMRIVYWTGEEGVLPHLPGRIFVVDAKGGPPRQLVPNYAGARYPVWFPDGRHILFEGSTERMLSWDKTSDWCVLDLDTGRVFATGAQPALRARGLTPFTMPSNFRGSSFLGAARGEQATNLYRIDLTPGTWRLAHPPQQLTSGTNIFMSPWISKSGRMVASNLEIAFNIWRIRERHAKNERPQRITDNAYLNASPTVSHDGRLMAFSRSLGRMRDIWLLNPETGKKTVLIAGGEEKYSIVLRPDGKAVAYSMNEEGRHSIHVISTESKDDVKLCSGCGDTTAWSTSLKELLVTNGSPTRIELLPTAGGSSTVLLEQPGDELGEAQFSPDGAWIAFRAGLGGDRSRLYVAPYRSKGFIPVAEWIPITDGRFSDDKPRWSTDGNALYFESTRDNFICLWMQRLDSQTRHPMGQPSPLIDFHTKEWGPGSVSSESFSLSVGGGYLFFNPGELRANVWIGTFGSTE